VKNKPVYVSVREYGVVDRLGNGQGNCCSCAVWRWINCFWTKLVLCKLCGSHRPCCACDGPGLVLCEVFGNHCRNGLSFFLAVGGWQADSGNRPSCDWVGRMVGGLWLWCGHRMKGDWWMKLSVLVGWDILWWCLNEVRVPYLRERGVIDLPCASVVENSFCWGWSWLFLQSYSQWKAGWQFQQACWLLWCAFLRP